MWIAVFITAAKLLHIPVNRYLVPQQVSRSESIDLTAQGYRIAVRGYGGDARNGMQGLPALKELGATVLRDSDQRYAALVVQFPRGSFQIVAGAKHDILGEGDEVIADDIGFNGRVIAELYKAAGLDIADKRVEAQTVELSRVMLELSEGEMDVDSIRAFLVSSSPRIDRTGIQLWNRVEILAWFLLGLASTVLVGWRLRRRLSRVDPLTQGDELKSLA